MKFTGLSIRSRLLGGFALNLVLLIALGLFALDQMALMNEEATRVESQTIPLFQRVTEVRDIITSYRSLQLEYLVHTNRSDRGRIRVEMRVLETRADLALNALIENAASEQEGASARRVRELWTRLVTANHGRFLPSVALSNTGTVQPAFTRLNPFYDELVTAAEALSEASTARTAAGMESSHVSYVKARNFFLAGTFAAVLIAAVMGFPLASSLAGRLRRLTSATIAVANGDLGGHVEMAEADEATRDELTLLSSNFNRMLDALRRKRGMLEERNDELAASLEEQRRLTEDLIAREHAEAEAQQAKVAAEAASEAKSMFLAVMSHELRTPLNSIAGFTQIMELEARARGDEHLLPDLGRIRIAGRHLLTLINNLLDFSKIEQGKIEVESGEVDPRLAAREAVELLAPQAREKGIALNLRIDEDLSQTLLWSDAVKIRQILFNLLSNAVKFTFDGEVRLDVSRRERILSFAVTDTGVGMREEDLERLFKPFERVSSAATTGVTGTGLGLAVTRELCRLLGGDVRVESRLGSGSTFTFTLPIADKDRQIAKQTIMSPIVLKNSEKEGLQVGA